MTHLTPPHADPSAALARFAAAAPADVVYAHVDSPIGAMLAARTERGLACLAYEDLPGRADGLVRQSHRRRPPAPRCRGCPGPPRGSPAPCRR